MDNIKMINDMNDTTIENTLGRMKKSYRGGELSDDFDRRVFMKIKKKKVQRKITASVSLGILICGLLFAAQIFFSSKKAEPRFAHKPDIPSMEPGIGSNSATFAKGEVQPADGNDENTAMTESGSKEEVPVLGEVIFASSDSQANYTIQQVGYTEENTNVAF
ncbi:MAG: hypothetical protein ACM3SY_20010 [Candidatus Omnitrophota bacterium]